MKAWTIENVTYGCGDEITDAWQSILWLLQVYSAQWEVGDQACAIILDGRMILTTKNQTKHLIEVQQLEGMLPPIQPRSWQSCKVKSLHVHLVGLLQELLESVHSSSGRVFTAECLHQAGQGVHMYILCLCKLADKVQDFLIHSILKWSLNDSINLSQLHKRWETKKHTTTELNRGARTSVTSPGSLANPFCHSVLQRLDDGSLLRRLHFWQDVNLDIKGQMFIKQYQHQTKLKAKYTVNTNLCATPVQSKYLLLPSLWFPPFLVFLYLSLAVQMQLLPLPAAWVIPCFPLTNKSGVIIMMTFDLCAHNYIQNLNLQRRTDWSIWWPN